MSRPSFTRTSFNPSASSHTAYQTPSSVDRKPRESGLGISNLGLRDPDKHDSPLGLHLKQNPVTGHGGNSPRLQAPTPSRPKSRYSELWTSIHAPPTPEPELVFERAFLDGEHNRLTNSACFVEEMTGGEREEHWIKLGRESGRHSAKEWKLYYERVVLPAYRAKVKTVETAEMTSGHTEDPITDGSISNTPANMSSTLTEQDSSSTNTSSTKRQNSAIIEDREAAVQDVVQSMSSTPEQMMLTSQSTLIRGRMGPDGGKSPEPQEVTTFNEEAPDTIHHPPSNSRWRRSDGEAATSSGRPV